MRRYFFLMYFITGLFSISAKGQIIPAGADTAVVTQYSTHDSIYIFHQLPVSKPGQLAAKSPFNAPSDFIWHRFYPDTHIFPTQKNTDTSMLSDIGNGGYQVDITSPGHDTSLFAWVFKDTVSSALRFKDGNGYLQFHSTCDYVYLENSVKTTSNFLYINPKTSQQFTLPNKLHYRWNADPVPVNPIQNPDSFKVWITPPPYDNSTFASTVTNQYGLSAVDYIKYISITPRAAFDTTGSKYYDATGELSASFHAHFKDSSSSITYTRVLYSGKGDTIYKFKDITLIYSYPGDYKVLLRATSLEGCVDTISKILKIAKSRIGPPAGGSSPDSSQAGGGGRIIPNIFTPSEGGENAYFKVEFVSLREFTITIFTRTGQKVYTKDLKNEDDLHNWEGWNGRMNGTGSMCSKGVYFYIIKAKPWDKTPDPSIFQQNGQYKGFFYLN